MLEKQLYRLKAKLKSLVTGSKVTDDFDWDYYTTHYKGELKEIARIHTEILSAGDCTFADGRLRVSDSILPLHPNHRLLYETICQLAPSSAIEFGCGGGDHLWNLQVLREKMELWGLDRSQDQIGFLHERHPELRARVECRDITMPIADVPRCELSYSQAVIMHIQTGDAHVHALENMFAHSARYVVLVENWAKHPFLDDIRALHESGRIAWENLYFYFRTDDAASLLIASAEPLTGYDELVTYEQLPQPA